MRIIAAQQIKKQGITVVEELVRGGDAVHVVVRNEPRYVVLTEERYRELMEEISDAAADRIALALADYREGRVTRYDSAEAYLAAVDARADTDDE
jgi:PHD/YefM family antitoxin component YafN of YafNO toxin-antitoxin module